MSEPRKLTQAEATAFYRDGIDEAVKTHDVALLAHLIRTANNLTPEAREHLAAVIEGLLAKRIKFPNRKPKQDLEEKRQAIAERVWEVKKTEGWKLRSVVDSVAKEMKCSPSTVWSAWGEFGAALEAGDRLGEKYDFEALFDAIKTAAPQGGQLSAEHQDVFTASFRSFHHALKKPALNCSRFQWHSNCDVDYSHIFTNEEADMSDTNFLSNDPTYTITEFCAAERISRVRLYELWKHGHGPRFYFNGRCRRITHAARIEWQREMEARVERQEVSDAA